MSAAPASETPFDRVIASINAARYHNHRKETHSDILSEGIFADLLKRCSLFQQDSARGVIQKWFNVHAPGDRKRNIDLFVGEPDAGKPNLALVRLCCEHKSVITAHRNATNRFDDLTKIVGSVHSMRPDAIIVATILIGVSPRMLNVADRIHPYHQADFESKILPRLSSGDESLFDEFSVAVSKNRPGDVERTIAMFRTLPTRQPGTTHLQALDYLLLVPVSIDNVHPATIARENPYGINVDRDYDQMIDTICAAYRARWHPMA